MSDAPSRLSRPGQWPGRSTVLASRGVVNTSHPLAAAAGIDALRRGGNAIDAALAASITLSVVDPLGSGIGGDAIALVRAAGNGKTVCINATGTCPSKLSWRTFARKGAQFVPNFGWPSIVVPGCVEGWWQLHQAGGRAAWKDLFGTAIEYARDGVPLSEVASLDFENLEPRLQNEAAREIFNPCGRAPQYGEMFKQVALAESLCEIAEGGRDVFYCGALMERMLAASDGEGGFFSRDDFAAFNARTEAPVLVRFGDIELVTAPPNSQGFSALLALNILSALGVENLKDDWGALAHATVEALKLAFTERDNAASDPNAVAESLTESFAADQAKQIDPLHAVARTKSIQSADGEAGLVCAADSDGNLVSLMTSLHQGSGIVAPDTGIHFNNCASAFSLDSLSPNVMEPGARPFSTLMPVLAMRWLEMVTWRWAFRAGIISHRAACRYCSTFCCMA